MEFLDELLNEIKEKYSEAGEILASELYDYKVRYHDFCIEQLEHKPSGFFGWVGVGNDISKRFDEAFSKLEIQKLEDPIEPLHSYELNKTGLARLGEVQDKIAGN